MVTNPSRIIKFLKQKIELEMLLIELPAAPMKESDRRPRDSFRLFCPLNFSIFGFLSLACSLIGLFNIAVILEVSKHLLWTFSLIMLQQVYLGSLKTPIDDILA